MVYAPRACATKQEGHASQNMQMILHSREKETSVALKM